MLSILAAIFAGLLIVTGVAKAARPADTARGLRELGIPGGLLFVRLLAIGEIGLGTWVLTTMNFRALILQGVLYSLFGLWVWFAIRLDVPMASCGCLGREDTPPYLGHLIMNVVAAMTSVAVAGFDGRWLSDEPLGIAAELVVVTTGIFLAWSVLGEMARVAALVRK